MMIRIPIMMILLWFYGNVIFCFQGGFVSNGETIKIGDGFMCSRGYYSRSTKIFVARGKSNKNQPLIKIYHKNDSKNVQNVQTNNSNQFIILSAYNNRLLFVENFTVKMMAYNTINKQFQPLPSLILNVSITCVDISPRQFIIAVGTQIGAVFIYKLLSNGTYVQSYILKISSNPINFLNIDDSSLMIAVGSIAFSPAVYARKDQNSTFSLFKILENVTSAATVGSISGDDQVLLIGSGTQLYIYNNLTTFETRQVQSFHTNVQNVDISIGVDYFSIKVQYNLLIYTKQGLRYYNSQNINLNNNERIVASKIAGDTLMIMGQLGTVVFFTMIVCKKGQLFYNSQCSDSGPPLSLVQIILIVVGSIIFLSIIILVIFCIRKQKMKKKKKENGHDGKSDQRRALESDDEPKKALLQPQPKPKPRPRIIGTSLPQNNQ